MLDFNGASNQPEHREPAQCLPTRDELVASLQLTAGQWVPAIFPHGKLDRGNGKGRIWRVADITGRAPRKQGSCCIYLDGDDAGGYHEYCPKAKVDGGDAVSTIADRFGLNGPAVYEKAREIAEKYGRIFAPARKGQRATEEKRQPAQFAPAATRSDDYKIKEADHELTHSVPARGTLAETYLNSRQLQLPATNDLRFGAETTYRENGAAYGLPCLLAVFRHPDGTPTGGVHRIFLKPDGSGKIKRMMLGPPGLVMLAQPNGAGELGIGEGVESSIAAMQLSGLPCWSAASVPGMTALAGALREGQTLPGVTRLVVFADCDDAGQKAAAELRDAAIAAGLQSEVWLPRGGDDFNDDLVRGLTGEPVIMPAAAPSPDLTAPPQLPQPPSAETLMAQSRSLGRNPELADLKRLFLAIASTSLDTLTIDRLLDTIRGQTKMKASSVAKCLKDARVELGLDILGSGSGGGNWLGKLRTSDAGNPKAVIANAITGLRDAPEWRDILWFDEFRQQVVLRGKAPWMDHATEADWTDNFDTKTAAWLQGYDIDVTPSAVTPAVDDIARENTFHPVREYLESLVPDGRKLLDIWLTYFLGVEPDPIDETLTGEELKQDRERYKAQTAYIRAVGRAWPISAVARIFKPGCKADCALILEGPQGKKKSMVFQKLGSPWFADEIAEFGSKDAAIQIAGVWIIELAELSTLRRSDRNRAKSFMSRLKDHYVPKYGRRWIDQLRECVFGGTANDSEYLNDPTGGRRWWPVRCGKIDIEALELCRDQLWAEAVAAYRAGEIWWLEDESLIAIARREQAARGVTDVWDERVAKYLIEQTVIAQTTNKPLFLTRADVLKELGIFDRDQTQIHANRVADILVRFGWERFQIGKGSLRGTWAYRPKKVENDSEVR